MTATPCRLDGAGLGVSAGGVFDALVTGPSVANLTAEGFLVPARVFAPAAPPDLRGIRTRAGDYDPAALTDLMGTAQMVEAVVAHYRLHVGDRPAVLFAASTRHTNAIATGLRASGIASKAISATTPAAEREAALSGLENGSVRILCSCDLISEGLDVPDIAAVILLRPTKSLALYLQQVGRGLRPAPGKESLIVLDHAGNSLAHGLPATPRRWTLNGAGSGGTTSARRMAAFCPACASIVRRARPTCRSCGAPLEQAEQPSSAPGSTLSEVNRTAAALQYAVVSRPLAELVREARTIDDLSSIQRARGFKPGWVWHQWRPSQGITTRQRRQSGPRGAEGVACRPLRATPRMLQKQRQNPACNNANHQPARSRHLFPRIAIKQSDRWCTLAACMPPFGTASDFGLKPLPCLARTAVSAFLAVGISLSDGRIGGADILPPATAARWALLATEYLRWSLAEEHDRQTDNGAIASITPNAHASAYPTASATSRRRSSARATSAAPGRSATIHPIVVPLGLRLTGPSKLKAR